MNTARAVWSQPRRWAWPAIGVRAWPLAAAVVTLALTVQPLRDSDVWWHLAIGRRIIATGIPAREPLSFLPAAHPWVGQQWLYEVLLVRLESLGGPGLMSLVMGTVASLALYLASQAVPADRRPAGRWAALAMLLSGAVAAQLLGVRGQVVSLLGAAVVLLAVSRCAEGRRGLLRALPLLFALWANLHAGFVVGLAILVVGVVALRVPPRIRLEMAVITLACTAATLLNPAGVGLWGYIAETFSSPTLVNVVTEWQSPDFHNLWLRLFELEAMLAVVVLTLSPRRSLFIPGLAALALIASLQSQRNVSLFALVAVPLLAEHGPSAWEQQRDGLLAAAARLLRRRPSLRPPPRWFGTLLALIAVGATVASLVPRLGSAAAAAYERQHEPAAALDWVQRTLPHPRIYAPDTWGGYVAYRLSGERATYLYDETAVFGDAALQQYLDIHDLRGPWATRIHAAGFTAAILPEHEQEVAAFAVLGWTVTCRDAASGAVVLLPPRPGVPAQPATQLPSHIHAAPACG